MRVGDYVSVSGTDCDGVHYIFEPGVIDALLTNGVRVILLRDYSVIWVSSSDVSPMDPVSAMAMADEDEETEADGGGD